jgi:hypothetical protein
MLAAPQIGSLAAELPDPVELKAAGLTVRARLEVSKLRVLLAAARALARHHSVPQVRGDKEPSGACILRLVPVAMTEVPIVAILSSAGVFCYDPGCYLPSAASS